jgi:tetratricopeptide (TPR) repeat protein
MTAPRHYYYPPILLLLLLVTATFTAADDDTATAETIIVASIEIELNANVNVTAANTGDISDKKEKCEDWAEMGECQRNPVFMLENCAVSCDTVSRKGKAYVYDGEDVGVAAFRFAEEYSNHFDSTTDTQQKVLEVAKELQDELKVQNYTPPQELTHCGKRQCSAGKLWKRAEEMRKADMHDDAGADLIRALLKTGIDTDFIERCQRSLQWAFNSIQRQREREKREAIEEEKLEVRRKEEQAAMESALERKKEYDADLVKFGNQLQESVAECVANGGSATVGADGTVETETDVEVEELILNVKRTFVADGPQGGNWDEVIELTKKLRPSDKTVDIFLIEARCHEMKGNHQLALSAAGRLISKAASYTSWKNDEPRMIAATLGANAAMQLGLSDNALSFYQTVLKFDPEQERARKQYRGLKKVVKLMDKAEEQVRVMIILGNYASFYCIVFFCSFFHIRFLLFSFRLKRATIGPHQLSSTTASRPCVALTSIHHYSGAKYNSSNVPF